MEISAIRQVSNVKRRRRKPTRTSYKLKLLKNHYEKLLKRCKVKLLKRRNINLLMRRKVKLLKRRNIKLLKSYKVKLLKSRKVLAYRRRRKIQILMRHKYKIISSRRRSLYEGAPDGLYDSTKKWLESTYGQEKSNCYYKEFYTDDVTHLNDSIGIDNAVHEHFRSSIVYGQPMFTAVIKNGRVWGKNGAVISPNNKLFGDVSWDYNKEFVSGNNHTVFHKWNNPALNRIKETTALLTFVWSGNYFHWLFDVLPRVDLLRQSGIEIDKYIVPRDNLAIQDETLNMLGIPKEKRIYTDRDFHARCDQLIVPSFVRSEREHPSEYPKWVTNFLRNEFLLTRDVPLSEDYERIYISRSKAWQRRLLNEEEVQTIMRERHFRIVTLEDLSFMEQVRIFASAQIVVAPHGAGLGNLVFCKPGTKVVEMFSPDYVSNYYWHLCNQVDLKHYYLIGGNVTKPNESWWAGSSDFKVDTEKLIWLLNIAGI